MEVKLLADKKLILGEGPFWDGRTKQFHCVDIMAGEIHCLLPGLDKWTKHSIGQQVGFAIPNDVGQFLVGLQQGIAVFDPSSNSTTFLSNIESELMGNRFNDGKCDANGRLWAGTMNLEAKPKAGNFYSMDENYRVHKRLSNISISNGLEWSLDNSTFYYIDTPTYKVTAFDFDLEASTITNQRAVIDVDPSIGLPDGMTIDSEGMLWIAHWDGNCVCRWNPETGNVLQKIYVPAAGVSSCCFGGEELDVLFITTAKVGFDANLLNKYPLSGGIFTVKPGVSGLPANTFKY